MCLGWSESHEGKSHMNMEEAIGKIVNVLNDSGFEQSSQNKYSNKLESCYLIREYATPDYIGNMVRINYIVRFDRNFYFGKIEIHMNAVIFKRQYSNTVISINEGCFTVYEDYMSVDDSVYEYDNEDYEFDREKGRQDFIGKCDDLKRKAGFMIELTEKRIKNIFGMERMA